MKKIIIATTITIGLLFSPALAREKEKSVKIYNSSNIYQGKITDDGKIRDKNNIYQGKITKDSKLYNSSNIYQGKLKK